MLEDMNFSIEMETGTGKTYVYLRTILELNKKYGFIKFVIIVPSVAIKEGVLKTLKITMLHFREIYEKNTIQLLRIRFQENQYDNVSICTIDNFLDTISFTLHSKSWNA